MRQENYNSVMTDFKFKEKIRDLKCKCPSCGFVYLGDGKVPCIECESAKLKAEKVGDFNENT